MSFEIGTRFGAHPVGPAHRLRRLVSGLDHHDHRRHDVDEDRHEHQKRQTPVHGEQVDQYSNGRHHRGDGIGDSMCHQIVQRQRVILHDAFHLPGVTVVEPAEGKLRQFAQKLCPQTTFELCIDGVQPEGQRGGEQRARAHQSDRPDADCPQL